MSCGNRFKVGNDAYRELNKVLEYIPPQSIGSLIGRFVRECELRTNFVDTFYKDFSDRYSIVRNFDNDYAEMGNELILIEESLKDMPNIGVLQKI